MNKKIHQKLLLILIILNLSILLIIHPLKENLTYLGNELHMQIYYFIWGCSSACSFAYFTKKIMNQQNYHNHFLTGLLYISCLLMIISLCIPYNLSLLPQLSKWHVRLAMTSTILYILIVLYFFTSTFTTNIIFFQKYMPIYTTILSILAFFFLIYGSVCTLLEIGFVISMNILFYKILHNNYY